MWVGCFSCPPCPFLGTQIGLVARSLIGKGSIGSMVACGVGCLMRETRGS